MYIYLYNEIKNEKNISKKLRMYRLLNTKEMIDLWSTSVNFRNIKKKNSFFSELVIIFT